MRPLWACAAASALAWAVPASADPVGLRVVCDAGGRYGAGAVVRDFRPGHERGVLLVTALHVVHGCGTIAPQKVTCSGPPGDILQEGDVHAWGKGQRPTDVLVWKEFDLAAVVVPEADVPALVAAVPPIEVGRDEKPPAPEASFFVIAGAGINVCPQIPAFRRDLFTADTLYRRLDNPDYVALFGSLDQSARLVSYQGTVVPGTSGGPVVMKVDQRHVFAVHLGGQALVLGWGILVDPKELLASLQKSGSRGVVRLDDDHPVISVEGFEEPKQVTDTATAALDLALHRDAVLAMLEVSTPVDPFGAEAIAPQIGWSRQWFSPGFARLSTAVGTRVVLGGAFGQYRSPMTGPRFEESARQGTAKLPFVGGFSEIDAELHLARLAPLQYVVGAGMRGGISHQRYVEAGADAFVWGPVIEGRMRWPWGDRIAGVAQLHLAVERIPVSATPLNCLGPSLSRPAIWDAWGGVAIGVEISP